MKNRSGHYPLRTMEVAVTVHAPQSAVWHHLVAWQTQGNWMLGTSVWALDSGQGVGGRIAAFTGLFPKSRKVGFIDYMTITKWEPPRVCDVLHTGKVVRGTGSFEVVLVSEKVSKFRWREDVEVPFGSVGQLIWPLASMFLRVGIILSLRTFASYVEESNE